MGTYRKSVRQLSRNVLRVARFFACVVQRVRLQCRACWIRYAPWGPVWFGRIFGKVSMVLLSLVACSGFLFVVKGDPGFVDVRGRVGQLWADCRAKDCEIAGPLFQEMLLEPRSVQSMLRYSHQRATKGCLQD